MFCDTSGFVALFVRSDMHHAQAKRRWQSMLRHHIPLFTSEYIFDELMTILAGKVSHAFACQVGASLLQSQTVTMLYVQDEQIPLIFKEFQRYLDQDLSFTDVASFFLMRQEGMHTAFTFDADFAKVGFTSY